MAPIASRSFSSNLRMSDLQREADDTRRKMQYHWASLQVNSNSHGKRRIASLAPMPIEELISRKEQEEREAIKRKNTTTATVSSRRDTSIVWTANSTKNFLTTTPNVKHPRVQNVPTRQVNLEMDEELMLLSDLNDLDHQLSNICNKKTMLNINVTNESQFRKQTIVECSLSPHLRHKMQATTVGRNTQKHLRPVNTPMNTNCLKPHEVNVRKPLESTKPRTTTAASKSQTVANLLSPFKPVKKVTINIADKNFNNNTLCNLDVEQPTPPVVIRGGGFKVSKTRNSHSIKTDNEHSLTINFDQSPTVPCDSRRIRSSISESLRKLVPFNSTIQPNKETDADVSDRSFPKYEVNLLDLVTPPSTPTLFSNDRSVVDSSFLPNERFLSIDISNSRDTSSTCIEESSTISNENIGYSSDGETVKSVESSKISRQLSVNHCLEKSPFVLKNFKDLSSIAEIGFDVLGTASPEKIQSVFDILNSFNLNQESVCNVKKDHFPVEMANNYVKNSFSSNTETLLSNVVINDTKIIKTNPESPKTACSVISSNSLTSSQSNTKHVVKSNESKCDLPLSKLRYSNNSSSVSKPPEIPRSQIEANKRQPRPKPIKRRNCVLTHEVCCNSSDTNSFVDDSPALSADEKAVVIIDVDDNKSKRDTLDIDVSLHNESHHNIPVSVSPKPKTNTSASHRLQVLQDIKLKADASKLVKFDSGLTINNANIIVPKLQMMEPCHPLLRRYNNGYRSNEVSSLQQRLFSSSSLANDYVVKEPLKSSSNSPKKCLMNVVNTTDSVIHIRSNHPIDNTHVALKNLPSTTDVRDLSKLNSGSNNSDMLDIGNDHSKSLSIGVGSNANGNYDLTSAVYGILGMSLLGGTSFKKWKR